MLVRLLRRFLLRLLCSLTAAAMLTLPVGLHAQFASVEMLSYDNTTGQGQFRVRNTQVEPLDGKVYGITHLFVGVNSPGYLTGGGAFFGVSGNVLTTPVPATSPFNGSPTEVHFMPNTLASDVQMANGFVMGPLPAPFDWLGILGCVRPLLAVLGGSYGGSTCAPAGYDGWLVFNYSLLFNSVANLNASQAPTVNVAMREFVAGPTTTLLPEPSSVVLMAAGLAGLGGVLARRKR